MHAPAHRMLSCLISLCSLATLISCHFTLDFPPARGFDEEQLGNFPCGGQNMPSTSRTKWPISGGQIQLDMEHERVAVQAFLAVGEDVKDSFNTIIYPLTVQTGFGDFCITTASVPSSLNITHGQNATIQVITTNESGGGLYNCADITFTDDHVAASKCANNTGVTAEPYTGSARLANQTTEESLSGGSESSDSATSSSSSAAAAMKTAMGGLGMIVGGAIGVVAML